MFKRAWKGLVCGVLAALIVMVLALNTLQPVPAAAPGSYTPEAGDLAFLDQRDLETDTNYASLSYWKGVFIHFFKNRRAVIGLIIIHQTEMLFL